MTSHRPLGWLLALTFFAGCNPPTEALDGAVDGGLTIEPPIAPHPLELPCRPGFEPIALPGGNTACEPWAELPTCAAGEILLATGCEPISPSCALTGLTDAAVFVRPGATGGDGTEARPYGTIAEARRVATEIALFEGIHDAPTGIALNGTRIVGACAGGTTIRLGGRVIAFGGGNELRSVTVEPMADGADLLLSAREDAALLLQSVELRGLGRGVEASPNSSVTLRRVAARDLVGALMIAFDPALIDAEQVSSERMIGTGISIEHDDGAPIRARFRLVDAVFASLRAFPSPGPAALNTAAVRVVAAASTTLDDVIVEDSDLSALQHAGPGLIEDLFVRDARMLAVALFFDDAIVHRMTVMDAPGGALFVAGGTAMLSDVAILRSGPSVVLREATATFDRLLVSEGRGVAIESGIGTATYRDVSIYDEVDAPENDGRGLEVRDGASVTVERMHIERVQVSGIAVFAADDGSPSHLDVSDVEVLDVARIHALDGTGITAEQGTTLAVHRAHVARTNIAGLYVHGASADFSDVRVEGTTGPTNSWGAGLFVASRTEGMVNAATVTARNVLLFDNERWSLFVTGPEARLELDQVRIAETRRAPCADTTCTETGGGLGLLVLDEATTIVRGFEIEGSEYAGVLAGGRVTVSLTGGSIHHNAVGIVVSTDLPYNLGQSPGLDFFDATLSDNAVPFLTLDYAITAPEVVIPPSMRAP